MAWQETVPLTFKQNRGLKQRAEDNPISLSLVAVFGTSPFYLKLHRAYFAKLHEHTYFNFFCLKQLFLFGEKFQVHTLNLLESRGTCPKFITKNY